MVRDRGVYFTAHAYVDGAISAEVFDRALDLAFARVVQHQPWIKAAAQRHASPADGS